VLKDLKQSTRQRFVALEFDYPAAELERRIVANESGVDRDGRQLVKFAQHDPQPQGQRPGRRRLDPPAGACRQADRRAASTRSWPARAPWPRQSPTMPTCWAIQELSSSLF
jgi:hypothetical protein